MQEIHGMKLNKIISVKEILNILKSNFNNFDWEVLENQSEALLEQNLNIDHNIDWNHNSDLFLELDNTRISLYTTPSISYGLGYYIFEILGREGEFRANFRKLIKDYKYIKLVYPDE